MSLTNSIKVKRIYNELCEYLDDDVVREFPLTLFVNSEETDTLLCSPEDMDVLVLGHLKSEGLIKDSSDIKSLIIDSEKGLADIETVHSIDRIFKRRYITSGCASSAMFYDVMDAVTLRYKKTKSVRVDGALIPKNLMTFYEKSTVFKQTGGVHMAALFSGSKLICFYEDIGRHNAVDKVIGHILKNNIDAHEMMLFISGRISSEMVLKCIKSDVGILVSKSAPMDLAVKFARNYNMVLVGFARGNRFNIYSGEESFIE